MELPGIAKAEALTLHPGDVLAVHIDREFVTAEEAHHVAERLRAIVPEGVKVAILEPDIGVEVQHGQQGGA